MTTKLTLSESAQLLNTEESAQLLCVTVPQMTTWRRKGLGPNYIKLNPSVIRYRMGDLVTFMDSKLQQVGVTA